MRSSFQSLGLLEAFRTSAVTPIRPMVVTYKAANENE